MPDVGSPLCVAVTGVGGAGTGGQILKAIRLAETSYTIVGTDASPWSSGLAIVDHPYVVPPASDPQYVPALLALCQRHAVRAVFPGSEPELRLLSQNRAPFEQAQIFLAMNSETVIDTCLDKERTAHFLASNGFRAPKTVRIESLDDISRVEWFPVVLKPRVLGSGSADVVIAQDRDELRAFAAPLLANGRSIVAQEYVGRADAEFTVGVLSSRHGDIIGSIALKRLASSGLGNRLRVPNRTARRDLGDVLAVSSGISEGEIGRFPEVTGQCEQVARALRSTGPLNLQCRLVAGEVIVFEINPRFSGTTSLRALVGFNEPDLLLRHHLLGKPMERVAYRSGVVLRSLHETLLPTTTVPRAVDLL